MEKRAGIHSICIFEPGIIGHKPKKGKKSYEADMGHHEISTKTTWRKSINGTDDSWQSQRKLSNFGAPKPLSPS